MVYCIFTLLILLDAYIRYFPIYIFVKFVVLILFNVKIFKVSLFQTVALMDSFALSAERCVFRSRFVDYFYMHLSSLMSSFC